MAQAGLLCAKEVGDRLRCSRRRAAKLLATGEIRAFRLGREWRTTGREVEAYIARELAKRDRAA